MKRLLSLTAIFSLLIPGFVQAGVIASIEFPKMQAVIKANQQRQAEILPLINTQSQEDNDFEYVFEPAPYVAHLTLAFINKDNMTVVQANERYPRLNDLMNGVARYVRPIDLTNNVVRATIEYWPGKFEIQAADGSKKKNYLNVVLKLEENHTLTSLATEIAQRLEKQYGIKQSFPFSAHFTLGRIYEKNDASLQDLNNYNLVTEAVFPPLSSLGPIVTDHIMLKGAGNSEQQFKLTGRFILK